MALLEGFSIGLSLVGRSNPQFDPGLQNTSKASLILGISGLFSGIALLVVLVRLYVRIFIDKRLAIDDYFTILASACASLVLACLIMESKHGLGRYTQFITRSDHAALIKLAYFHFIILGIAIFAVKFSFVFFLLRILPRGKAYIFLKIILCYILLLGLANFGFQIFRCIPVSAGWSLTERDEAKCLSRRGFMVFNMIISGMDAIVDAIVVTFCTFVFYNFHQTQRYRLAFCVIATFGYITCFASIIKTAMSVYALKVNIKYRGVDYGLWSLLELNLALIAASLSTLGPLYNINHPRPRRESTTIRSINNYSSHYEEDIGLSSFSNEHPLTKFPRRPSTAHVEPNDFEKNPGNRSSVCNYSVEVTALNSHKTTRKNSFKASRQFISHQVHSILENKDISSCPPTASLADELSGPWHDGIGCSSPANAIVRRTDVYVRMDDVLDEECIVEEEEPEKKSKWKR